MSLADFFGALSSQRSALNKKAHSKVTQRGRKEILVNSGNQKWPGMKSIAIIWSFRRHEASDERK
jgi:hypothetical protein